MKFDTKQIKLAKGLTKKRSVRVQVASEAYLYGGYWDEGSRTTWFAIDLSGKRSALQYPTSPPQFGGGEPPTVQIVVPGMIVVRGGVVCGKDATLTFMVHPVDLLAVLGMEKEFFLPDHSRDSIAVMFDWLEERGLGELRTNEFKTEIV